MPRNDTFSLVTRTGSYQIRIDRQTQVWDHGTQVRPTSLRDGRAVGVRGSDHGRYALAQSIGLI